MPIRDWPFSQLSKGDILRAILPVKIINPHTDKDIITYGIIDTGADECAVPASYAPLLGHNLQSGTQKSIRTGNGVTAAYAHTTKIEIIDPKTNTPVYTVPDTPIDFMPNLPVVLIGVNSFLSNFTLQVDYPRKVFSITKPR